MQKNKEQTYELICAIEKLCCTIEDAASFQNRDYSQIFINIFTVLKEIGVGYKNDGCLQKIHKELHLLNKTLIMSALLISATKDPERTLDKYYKIIEQYLE